MPRLVVLAWVLGLGVGATHAVHADSLTPSIGRTNAAPQTLGLSLGASALVPGLGQALNRSYVKGGLFFVSQAITGAVTWDRYAADEFWLSRVRAKEDIIEERGAALELLSDSLAFFRARIDVPDRTPQERAGDSLGFADYSRRSQQAAVQLRSARIDRDLVAFDRRLNRYAAYNAVSWSAGVYVYNLLDVLDASGWLSRPGKRDPVLAGWLCAIPALALGQLYNGSPGKAGLIFAAQTGLGVMAFNYHRLMSDADEKAQELVLLSGEEKSLATGFSKDWDYRRDNAFRRRNTYLWYSLILYGYGIFDAVVDAHLSDAPEKMRLEPDLSVHNGAVGLTVNIDIARPRSIAAYAGKNN